MQIASFIYKNTTTHKWNRNQAYLILFHTLPNSNDPELQVL